MSSIQARKDEIAAKKAKLAELKRQRELRQKEFTSTRQSLGQPSEPASSAPSISSNRAELDELVSSLIDRPDTRRSSSRGLTPEPSSTDRPSSRVETQVQAPASTYSTSTTQTLAFATPTTVYSVPSAPKAEYVTYTKGVQTDDSERFRSARYQRRGSGSSSQDESTSPTRGTRKRLTRREREQDEELRLQLRKEIEAEIEALRIQEQEQHEAERKEQVAAPTQLSRKEVDTVTASDDFVNFIERSSKVLERALEEEYDVLADYTAGGGNENDVDNDDESGGGVRDKTRRIRQIHQFKDDTLTPTRMITDLDFAPKRPELLLASYTKASNSSTASPGLALVWNSHMLSRPEFTFTATTDILCARFSPYHPNLILGGTYSGQVCLWDMRARSNDGGPVQRTPLAGERGGHAHPVYSIAVVGTQNANSIVSVSTDGQACAWSFDMLSKPQENMSLTVNRAASRDNVVAPTCMSFSRADQTTYLAGTEEGSLVSIQRYDRPGAKAGIDQRIEYRGHAAPVTGLEFHPSRGKIDLSDLALSSGLDWSVKLWRARPQGSGLEAATTSSSIPSATISSTGLISNPSADVKAERALLDITKDEAVYDVKWSPVKAGVFGCVDGAGKVDVFDLNRDLEVPVSSAQPAHLADDVYSRKSLNKLAWEKTEGRKVAVGGLDGIVTVFEVGTGLGGSAGLEAVDEWMGIKKLVSKLDR